MLLAHELFWYLVDFTLLMVILLLLQRLIFNAQNQRAIFRRKSLLKKMLPVIEKSLNDILKDLVKDNKKETTNEKDKDLEPEDDDEDLDDIVDDLLK